MGEGEGEAQVFNSSAEQDMNIHLLCSSSKERKRTPFAYLFI